MPSKPTLLFFHNHYAIMWFCEFLKSILFFPFFFPIFILIASLSLCDWQEASDSTQHAGAAAPTARRPEESTAYKQSKDVVCGICMDKVYEKRNAQSRRFGILPNCSHAFCIECIVTWRKTKEFQEEVIKWVGAPDSEPVRISWGGFRKEASFTHTPPFQSVFLKLWCGTQPDANLALTAINGRRNTTYCHEEDQFNQ